MIYGINVYLAGFTLVVWAVGFFMGLLTSSIVRDIIKGKIQSREEEK